jgi:hypothetical protein
VVMGTWLALLYRSRPRTIVGVEAERGLG